VTRLYTECAGNLDVYPERKGLRNFTWTNDAISEWEDIWHQLWRFGYKWEWQNADRYARRRGDTFNLFAVHNDAVRLDMAIPLPGIVVIEEAREKVLEDVNDAHELDQLVGTIDRWLKKHYAP
jgi:hypothetical protein